MKIFSLLNYYCSKCHNILEVKFDYTPTDYLDLWHPTKEYHGDNCEFNDTAIRIEIKELSKEIDF